MRSNPRQSGLDATSHFHPGDRLLCVVRVIQPEGLWEDQPNGLRHIAGFCCQNQKVSDVLDETALLDIDFNFLVFVWKDLGPLEIVFKFSLN